MGVLELTMKKGEGRGTPWVMGKSRNGSQSWNLTLQPLWLFIVKTLVFYHGHLLPIYNSNPSTHLLIASSLWVWDGERRVSLSERLREYSTPGLWHPFFFPPPPTSYWRCYRLRSLVTELTVAKTSTPKEITILSLTTEL